MADPREMSEEDRKAIIQGITQRVVALIRELADLGAVDEMCDLCKFSMDSIPLRSVARVRLFH